MLSFRLVDEPNMKILGIDTETTGLDPFHGSSPYLVTTCDEDLNNHYWEWPVDPHTREVQVSPSEFQEVWNHFLEYDLWVFQNSKFDMRQLDLLARRLDLVLDWPWDRIHELTVSSHLLASGQQKDLTTLGLVWCGINLSPFEVAVQKATVKARNIVTSKAFVGEFGSPWAKAQDDREDMPSGGNWKADMWMLRALCQLPEWLPDWGGWVQGDPEQDHPFQRLAEEYANPDSATTVSVFLRQQEAIRQRGLDSIYRERLRLLPLVYRIEEEGVTVSKTRTKELCVKFGAEADLARNKCLALSDDRLGKLPISGSSNKLKEEVFVHLGLESPKKTKTGQPAMDKEVLDFWLQTLPVRSKQSHFIQSLRNYRKRMTALNYMASYNRFGRNIGHDDLLLLNPSINMCGTQTLRWSSSNPNEQNVSKQEGFNLRYTFGPPPGFAWASLDYENLEMRIPTYESGEDVLVWLFERPDEPPFYGSNHLLNFSIIYPELWNPLLDKYGKTGVGDAVKKAYKSTWYQRCKNGWFAIQYGAVETEGRISTADRAFGKVGGHAELKSRLGKLEALNKKWIDYANKHGIVLTLPDKLINPTQGYPLQCKRTKWGKVSPTIPLNYHVQGTACWIISIAMLACAEYLDDINQFLPPGERCRIAMQIHDELVFEFPLRRGYRAHLRNLRDIMASMGDRVGVPLKVGCDIHYNNWAEGVPL